MIRNEVRAQVAANRPGAEMGADGHGGQSTKAAAAPPPEANRPAAAPGRGGPPWLVRNSRKSTIALVLAILAASPFAYRYLQREFGPDPLAGIKVDDIKVDAMSGTTEVVKPARAKAPDADPSAVKPGPAAGAIGLAPKAGPAQASEFPARPIAAAPAAPTSGVTHTRPAVATPVKPEAAPPVAAIPRARDMNARPRESVREDQTASGACTEAVAALGFCNPNSTGKAK